jgi:hypothetical protein
MRPAIELSLRDPAGKRVDLQAWPSDRNDFNVAVMRLDGGSLLYEISAQEWEALRMLSASRAAR